MLCFCKFLCLLDVRICVSLNRTEPWGDLTFCSSRRNCICVSQFPFWFILEQCSFDLCTIVLMKGFSLQLLFPSERESHSAPSLLFGPLLSGWSYKITVLYLPVHQQFGIFIMGCYLDFYFFQSFCAMVDNWNI